MSKHLEADGCGFGLIDISALKDAKYLSQCLFFREKNKKQS